MRDRSPGLWIRYGAAVACTAAALACRAVLYHYTARHGALVPFFPAIVAAVVYGGWGPGLLAVILSVTAAALQLHVLPVSPLRHPADLASVGVFAGVGVLIVYLCEEQRSARRRLRRVTINARCMLWDAEINSVERDATGASTKHDALQWKITIRDEEAAQHVVPLDVTASGSYLKAFESSQNPTDRQELTQARARALSRGDESYRCEFRCTDKNGCVHWLQEEVTIRPIGRCRWRAAGVVTDVTPNKQAEHALREAHAMLSAVNDGTTDAVFIKDLQGRYLMINPAGAAHVGTTVEGVVGKDDTAFFRPESARKLRQDDQRVVDLGRTFTFETEHVMPGGHPKTFQSTKSPYRDSHGAIIGIIGIARDITERRQAERERAALLAAERAARAQAERAGKAKDDFLACLSHELRTPLTPVLLLTSLLDSRADLPQDAREDVATIRRNVELEARLIDDLLDLTRVARGKLRLEMQTADVHLLVHSALDACWARDERRPLLELNARRHYVRGDPARLQQVLWNLLSNARKFTPTGGSITVRTADGPDERIVVSVIDTGQGIEADLLPRIFDAFEQGDAAAARQFGGLGLGLAISRAIVHAHGGAIEAYSAGRGTGATFTVLLPVVPEPVATGQNPPTPRHDRAPRGPRRILLVEDHESTLATMHKLLVSLGHQVRTASCVRDALDIACTQPIDLVISDVALGDGTGHELMRELRDRCPVVGIAVSGYGMEDDVRRSHESGFAEHLVKPIDPGQLKAAIERVSTPA